MDLTIRNKSTKKFLDFMARVAISSIFISAIPGKILGFSKTVEDIASKGIPAPIVSIAFVGAIICLILGSGFFIFGKDQKIGAILLILFLIPTTIVLIIFPNDIRAIFNNLSLIGALLIPVLREQK